MKQFVASRFVIYIATYCILNRDPCFLERITPPDLCQYESRGVAFNLCACCCQDEARVHKFTKRIHTLEEVSINVKLLTEMLSHYNEDRSSDSDKEIIKVRVCELTQTAPKTKSSSVCAAILCILFLNACCFIVNVVLFNCHSLHKKKQLHVSETLFRITDPILIM